MGDAGAGNKRFCIVPGVRISAGGPQTTKEDVAESCVADECVGLVSVPALKSESMASVRISDLVELMMAPCRHEDSMPTPTGRAAPQVDPIAGHVCVSVEDDAASTRGGPSAKEQKWVPRSNMGVGGTPHGESEAQEDLIAAPRQPDSVQISDTGSDNREWITDSSSLDWRKNLDLEGFDDARSIPHNRHVPAVVNVSRWSSPSVGPPSSNTGADVLLDRSYVVNFTRCGFKKKKSYDCGASCEEVCVSCGLQRGSSDLRNQTYAMLVP